LQGPAVFARAQDITRDVMRQLLAKHGITGPTAEAVAQGIREILLAVAHGPHTAQTSSARDPMEVDAVDREGAAVPAHSCGDDL